MCVSIAICLKGEGSAGLFVLEPRPDVRPARLDQRVQLRHERDEPHEVAADEGDDERRAPSPVVEVSLVFIDCKVPFPSIFLLRLRYVVFPSLFFNFHFVAFSLSSGVYKLR